MMLSANMLRSQNTFVPTACLICGAIVWLKIASISMGTPGKANKSVPSMFAYKAGAVPIGFITGRVFFGKVAILTLGEVISISVGICLFLAYSTHLCLTISSAFWLTASFWFRALAIPWKVLSSKVGPS